MFTADEYETAIKVLRAHSCEDLAEGFVQFQEQVTRQEQYVLQLGYVGSAHPPVTRGQMLLAKLLDDGWTPPRGLL